MLPPLFYITQVVLILQELHWWEGRDLECVVMKVRKRKEGSGIREVFVRERGGRRKEFLFLLSRIAIIIIFHFLARFPIFPSFRKLNRINRVTRSLDRKLLTFKHIVLLNVKIKHFEVGTGRQLSIRLSD